MSRALLMQANIFLIISTLLIVKPTVNGLFLAKFGVEQLPYAFILVAFAAALVSTLYSKLILRITLYKIFRFSLLFSIIILIIFGILLRANISEAIVLYIFYLWVAIFALVTTSQFWILANLLFDPREAKRVFSFIGAGAIAGGIFGGYLTTIMSNSFSSEFLTIVAAIMLTPTLFITRHLWKNYVEAKGTVKMAVSQAKYDTRNPIQILKESKHLRLIAAIVGVSVMVAKLVDYQFGGLASELIKDPNELTAFFGFWFSTFNIISLGLQLFVTPRVVGTYGVGSSLFILPFTIMVAVLFIFFFPEMLFAIVLLKLSDGGLKQSINKAAMELLIFPVPQELKNKTKTFIDVFIDSLATGLIGIILIFFIRGLGLSYRSVSVLTLFLIGIWLYLANLVREEYLKTLTLNLRSLSPAKKPIDFDLSNHSMIEGMQKVMIEGTNEQKLFILQKIRTYPDKRFFPNLLRLIDSPVAKIRSEALQNLYQYSEPINIAKIKSLTKDTNQAVRVHAIEYMIRHSSDKGAIVNEFINESDLQLWGASLVGLARETKHNQILANKTNLNKLVRDAIKKENAAAKPEDRRFITIAILKAIGHAHLQEFYSYIDIHLENKDDAIMKHAIAAAGEAQSVFFFETLMLQAIESIGIKKQYIILALAQYEKSFLELLNNSANGLHNQSNVQKIVPSILKKIQRQSSVDYLFNQLSNKDYYIRREAMRGLNELRNSNIGTLKFDNNIIVRQLKITANGYMDMLTILYTQSEINENDNSEEKIARDALMKALEKRIDRRLEIMFRLIGLRYPPEDIMPAYKGIKSNKIELRTSAMEMLDNVLDKDLRKILMPIIESTILEPISPAVVRRLRLSIPEETESYIYLLSHGDERIILAVLYLLKYKENVTLLEEVERLSEHQSEKVRFRASELIAIYKSRG